MSRLAVATLNALMQAIELNVLQLSVLFYIVLFFLAWTAIGEHFCQVDQRYEDEFTANDSRNDKFFVVAFIK